MNQQEMKQKVQTQQEEAHLQECRALIQHNIDLYEQQVEERHKETQALVSAVQSGNVELYDQMFTSQSLEEHSRNQLKKNRAAYEKPFFGRIDYKNVKALSYEAREKLMRIDPATIDQAMRIPGVSPSDISILLVLLGR